MNTVDLYKRLQAHDPLAEEELVLFVRSNYFKKAFLGLDQETREDLLQELTLDLLRAVRRDMVASPENFKTYAFRIALNIKNEYFRHLRARPQGNVIPIDDVKHVLRASSNPELDARSVEAVERVAAALKRMKDDLDREILRCALFEHQTNREIGEALQMTELKVRVRRFRAIRKLRELLRLRSKPPLMLAAA